MQIFYRKPALKSYSATDVLEVLGPCQNSYTATLYCTPDQNVATGDGCVNSDGGVNYSTYYDYVGNLFTNVVYRSFMGFNISSLGGKTIVSATLRIFQDSSPVDNNSYVHLGNIVADRFDFGDSLDALDYSAAALSTIGTISSNDTHEWKTLDVKSTVQSDINDGRTVSQFRVRHETDTGGGGAGENRRDNFVMSNTGDAEGTGNGPQLVVTYD